MFLGHPQVLFYARPPNSQLLFSEPGNSTFAWDFVEPVGPQNHKKYKPKVNFFGSPSSFVI